MPYLPVPTGRRNNNLVLSLLLIKTETADTLWAGGTVLPVDNFPEGSVPEDVSKATTVQTETASGEIKIINAPYDPSQPDGYIMPKPVDTSQFNPDGSRKRPEPIYNKYGIQINENCPAQPQFR